jgi:hypothetical protein
MLYGCPIYASVFSPGCCLYECRDLKPENLIMTSDDNNADLKIVDFGFAAIDTGGTPCCFVLCVMYYMCSACFF